MRGYPLPLNYGDEVARKLKLPPMDASVIKPGSKSQLAITRLRTDLGFAGPSDPITTERAFMLSVHLREPDWRNWKTSCDGKFFPVESWLAGGIGLYDLESNPIAYRGSGFDCVNYNLPRASMDAFTEQHGLPRVGSLPFLQGKVDPVLKHLSLMILPAIGVSSAFSDLFWESFVLIFCTHIASQFAGVRVDERLAKGGLAPWQKRRALEMLNEHISSGVRLHTLSQACGLSSSQFARSFKQTFGASVHRYFIGMRIERAKTFMAGTRLSLAQVAIETGFPDQPGFCRAFAGLTGTTPGKWRREHQFRQATCLGATRHHVEGSSLGLLQRADASNVKSGV